MRREWIGRIDFDPAIAAKIRTKHNLTEYQIREAVMFGYSDRAVMEHHSIYGERLNATGTTADGIRIKVFLRPVDRSDGHWECRTAIRVD